MNVMPSAPSSRVSRVTIRSKFSSVNLPTASVRPMSVNARTTSMTTGATKNTSQQHQRRPEEQAEVDPLSSKLGAREVGHDEVVGRDPEGERLVPSLLPDPRTSRRSSSG